MPPFWFLYSLVCFVDSTLYSIGAPTALITCNALLKLRLFGFGTYILNYRDVFRVLVGKQRIESSIFGLMSETTFVPCTPRTSSITPNTNNERGNESLADRVLLSLTQSLEYFRNVGRIVSDPVGPFQVSKKASVLL